MSRYLPGVLLHAAMLCAVIALPASAAGQLSSGDQPFVEITFLDVGHGDAIVVREPTGEVAMFDAGSGEILRFLQRMRVDSLSLLVGSHPDPAHGGGLVDVLTARPVARFVHGGFEGAITERLSATLERLPAVGVTPTDGQGGTLSLGAATVRVLPSLDSSGVRKSAVGVVVEFGAFRAMLTGDASHDDLTFWVDSGEVPDVTLLKAPAHGRVTSVNRPFLAVARPEVVVVSAGSENTLGLPRAEAMTAYESVAAEVFRTDRGGHVTVLGYEDGRYDVVRPSDLSSIVPTDDIRPASMGPRPVERGTLAPFSLIWVDVEPGLTGSPAWDLNAEYVTIGNHGPSDVSVGGWTVCDLSSRCFRFPPNAVLGAANTLRVYSGYGHTDGFSFFMNETRPIWNDNGDQVTVSDASGVVRGRHVY